MYRLLPLILFLGIHLNLFSQEVVYKQFSSENGFVSSYASQVLLDNEDYIWVSTNNGVVRFDGYSFENFNTNNKLPENDIVSMYKSEDQKIWFLGASGNLSYFEDEEIHLYQYNNKVIDLLEDYDFIEPKSVIITNEYIEFNVFEYARYRINKAGKVSVIYSLDDKINYVDLRNKQTKYFISSQNSKLKLLKDDSEYYFNIPTISCGDPILLETRGDTVYIASQNTIYTLFDDKMESYSFDNAIESIDVDIIGELWVEFRSIGVFAYKDGVVSNKSDFYELKGNSISSVIRDRQNSIWISSLNGGVFYLPSELFKQVTTKDGLFDNSIARIDFSNNYLWAITGNNAIARLSYTDIENYEFNNDDYSAVTDLFWYSNKLWVSFKNKICFFKDEQLVDVYRLDKKYDKHSRINRINAGNGKNLWLSKTDGFAQLRNNKIVFESSVKDFQNLNVNSIVSEPNGTLWLACKNGLWKYENNKLYNYNKTNKLLSKNIIDLVKDDKNGALWMAVNGYGLVKMQNDSIWLLSEEDGLISNSITSLYAWDNCIWVGTKKGISKIEILKTGHSKFTNLTIKDGLVSNEINDILANEQFVFYATNKGLGFFNYKEYKPNKYTPRVKIISAVVNGKTLNLSSDIVIDYFSNNLKINFKAIYIKSRGDITYRYKIEGLDKDWNYTNTLSVNYPFVPSGKYTFQVEASNENGIWQANPTEISIEVGKPFWLEWWFFVLVFIAILLITYLFYRILLYSKRRKEKLRQEINEYRQMALTRQMNPHFIFNSLNSIQHYILQNDARLSSRFLTKFSKLIRFTLENSQNSLISLEKELISLNLYLELESLRFKDKMQYSINLSPEIDTLSVNIPPMLIQPFVENAIWHGIMNKEDGETGVLKISFEKVNDSIVCELSDNGVGREKANEINAQKNSTHNSMGTMITHDRIDLINSIYKKDITVEYIDLKDIHGKSEGTTVKIIFNT